MAEGWHRRPGDRVIRLHRGRTYRLRRVLGIPALYSAGYGNVGSSIYYALGVVALVALGATPIALGIAGIFFVFTALTYAEGSAMLPEAGGSSSFARHGFNDLVGFIAGWALMLSFIVTISISAFTIPPYLSYFWQPLKDSPMVGTDVAMGIVFFLMIVNILGVRETSFVNLAAATIDLFTQGFLVLLGFIFLFSPDLISQRISANWPTLSNLVFGIALAALAYTGVETVSQMSEETRRPGVRVPRALILMIITVLVLFASISLVAFSVMEPQELATQWAENPVAGIAHNLPLRMLAQAPEGPVASIIFTWFVDLLRRFLPFLVSMLAAIILLIATNAGLMGVSRLAFSLGRNRQIPAVFSHVHSRFKTPYVSIVVFALVALLILIPGLWQPGFLTSLGALYTFGSLLSFALAHASIVSLRLRRPEMERPFKLRPNIRVRGRELPITALLGLVATLGIWVVLVIVQPYGRWVGFAWMVVGLALYALFRWRKHLPLGRRSVDGPPA
ncbi:MAG: APC family permease [Dehalococcoidia bacterium]